MKVAFVTGAGRGIGAATAKRLANDGYTIAALDLQEPTTGDLNIACDVSKTSEVEDAVQKTIDVYKRIDVLVNNAGVIRDNMLFKMTDDDWDTVMNVHLRGAFLCSRAVQRHMVAQKSGRIINLSSTSALGNRGQANYAAAKAGVQGFTRTLAIELGPYGINVNSIAPGFIFTPMIEETARRMGVSTEDFKKAAAESLHLRRTGTPEDIAGVVSFLAGPDSSYITGQNIYVDGGFR